MIKVEFSFVNAKNQLKNVNFYMDEKSYEMSLKLNEDERQKYLLEEYREYCKEQHYRRRVFTVDNLRNNEANCYDALNILVKESAFRKAINVLNDNEKELIVKYFFNGISKVEIAKEYHITEGAVRKRIKKCLNKMEKVIIFFVLVYCFEAYFRGW